MGRIKKSDKSFERISQSLSGVEICTKNLVLRAFRKSDIVDYAHLVREREVMEPFGSSVLECSSNVLNMVETMHSTRSFIQSVIKNTEGRLIGQIEVQPISPKMKLFVNTDNVCTLGIAIVKEEWGKGYATEALSALIKHLFENIGLEAVTCQILMNNQRSIRLFEGLGFEKVMEGETVIADEKKTVYYYCLKK